MGRRIDSSLIDPLCYFSFQPVLHDWCKKGRCMCYHRIFVMNGRKEIFYLTTHSTHFIYCYMASDIWLRTILIVRKETRCRHMSYSFRLTAKVLLYAPSHRQDSTYHGLCYTSRYYEWIPYAVLNRSTYLFSCCLQQRPWYVLFCLWGWCV